MMTKCSEKTKAGKPCQGKALKNGRCFVHQPAPDDPPAEKRPTLIRVKAENFYHNGMIATNWRPEEVREVSRETYRLLVEDAPRNWKRLDA